VLPDRIELSTSPLPRECSTTELRQQGAAGAPPEARGNCHKGWQGARKVPRDRAGRRGRRRHAAPAPLRRGGAMRLSRWPLADATAVLPLPLAGEGGEGAAAAPHLLGRLKTSAISSSPALTGERRGGRSRLESTPKGILETWRINGISTLHGVVPSKIVWRKTPRVWRRLERRPRAAGRGPTSLPARPHVPRPAPCLIGLASSRRVPQNRGHDPSALRRGPGAARGGAAGEPGAAQGPGARAPGKRPASAPGGRPAPAPGRPRAGAARGPIAANRRRFGTRPRRTRRAEGGVPRFRRICRGQALKDWRQRGSPAGGRLRRTAGVG
jgi:hypothetical protein